MEQGLIDALRDLHTKPLSDEFAEEPELNQLNKTISSTSNKRN